MHGRGGRTRNTLHPEQLNTRCVLGGRAGGAKKRRGVAASDAGSGGAGALLREARAEEAVERLGPEGVRRIERGFERQVSGEHLREVHFKTGVLRSLYGASDVPDALARALFGALDARGRGHLSADELVCGLAVLRCGTVEERVRLLFEVFDAAGRDREALFPGVSEAMGHYQLAGREGLSVDAERFASWAAEHIDSPLLGWVFDMEQLLGTQLGREPSAGCLGDITRTLSAIEREDVAEIRRICMEIGEDDERLVVDLRSAWRDAAARSKLSVVDAGAFREALPSLPGPLAERLFCALDHNCSGTIGLAEWTGGLARCIRARAEPGLVCQHYHALFSDGPHPVLVLACLPGRPAAAAAFRLGPGALRRPPRGARGAGALPGVRAARGPEAAAARPAGGAGDRRPPPQQVRVQPPGQRGGPLVRAVGQVVAEVVRAHGGAPRNSARGGSQHNERGHAGPAGGVQLRAGDQRRWPPDEPCTLGAL
ncbi:unnamed protein product [Prorocentrum cordatum]|uniref:Calmodulin n=1 Tax=Prorocentrum cordatum TaxID=2364126 RepID=A0ABN9U802_9DINO|nr:unnamed protein product [Polarella glacialis]